jgi:20S proteasome alpha/beta subunit
MSLGIVVKGSEGIVLAADSRVTLTVHYKQPDNSTLQLPVNFDNATKLLTFAEPNNWIGAVTYGDAVIGSKHSDLRTAKSLIPEFEISLQEERLSVEAFSKRLSDFFLTQWTSRMPKDYKGLGMAFVVGGFDEDSPYGSVFEFNIPNEPDPKEAAKGEFGMTMGGQPEVTSRMIQGYDVRLLEIAQKTLRLTINQKDALEKALRQLQLQIPFPVLPLQDCIDLAVFLIKTTSTAQNLSIGLRGVGGDVDVAVVTQRDGLKIIQQKELIGDKSVRTKER